MQIKQLIKLLKLLVALYIKPKCLVNSINAALLSIAIATALLGPARQTAPLLKRLLALVIKNAISNNIISTI
jgi:hypothetical protein